MCPLSPHGLKFRSKASLQAFLLKNGQEDLNINLFNFTASKDHEVTTPSIARQKGKTKKHDNEQPDDATGVSDSPLNKSARTCSELRGSTVKAVKDSVDLIGKEKIKKVQSTSSIVEDVAQPQSPHRTGLLREKILRLVPKQQNACKDSPAGSSLVPTLNLEPPAEGENKEEDERGGKERQVDSRGGKGADSEHHAGVNSVGMEVLSPEISGGSSTEVADSQNSKYDLHCNSL